MGGTKVKIEVQLLVAGEGFAITKEQVDVA